MRIASVQRARVFAIFQIADLAVNGNFFYPDFVKAFIERYQFQKYPTKAEEFDENKGIEFEMGRYEDGAVIDKVIIYNSGLVVDTSSSTDKSEEIMENLLKWAAGEFDLVLPENIFTKRAFINEFYFYSDAPLLLLHPMFAKIAKVVTSEVKANFGHALKYETTGLTLQHDPSTIAAGTAPFLLQRALTSPFEDNRYYSVAPIKTKIHYDLIEQLEIELGK